MGNIFIMRFRQHTILDYNIVPFVYLELIHLILLLLLKKGEQ